MFEQSVFCKELRTDECPEKHCSRRQRKRAGSHLTPELEDIRKKNADVFTDLLSLMDASKANGKANGKTCHRTLKPAMNNIFSMVMQQQHRINWRRNLPTAPNLIQLMANAKMETNRDPETIMGY